MLLCVKILFSACAKIIPSSNKYYFAVHLENLEIINIIAIQYQVQCQGQTDRE